MGRSKADPIQTRLKRQRRIERYRSNPLVQERIKIQRQAYRKKKNGNVQPQESNIIDQRTRSVNMIEAIDTSNSVNMIEAIDMSDSENIIDTSDSEIEYKALTETEIDMEKLLRDSTNTRDGNYEMQNKRY